MKKYIEVINIDTKECHLRMDVTGKSNRGIERVMMGVLINLNKDEYYVTDTEYETEQPIIN